MTIARRRALRAIATLPAMLIAGRAAAAKPPSIGEPAPPFEGTTLNDETISFEALRGNVVILNFWATWRGPCKHELPIINGYMGARKDNGLRVLAVTTDADRVPVKAIKALQDVLSFPLLKRFKGGYAPIKNMIPTNYIIDRSGVLRYAKANALDLNALNTLLVPLLNEPAPRS